MKNSKYWEKRIANNTWTTYNNLEEKNRALLEMYQDASRAISYELYALTEKMQTATPSLSDMHKYNRLNGLRNNIENIIRELGENVEKFGKENMMEGFKDIYSNVMVQLGKLEFDEVPKKVMEEMLNRPWQGGTFSERLWKNTQVLAMNLNEIITNGLTQGKTVTEMAIQLSNTMNTSFNISHRLIRTETMHYLNESAFKGYEDAGCEEVELWAAEDERTCEICGAKHGTKYKIKDRPILPLHANCRCTYLPVVESKNKNYGAKSGALTSKNDSDFKKRDKHAETYYRSVRRRSKAIEISTIANNTGFEPKTIEKVYNHIFINKYDLDQGYENFAPDYDMSESWRRLREGKNIQEHDLIMIKHERLEYELMNKYNKKYEEAHKLTEKKYNYYKALKEYLKKNNLE